jgi:hypothetical protein
VYRSKPWVTLLLALATTVSLALLGIGFVAVGGFLGATVLTSGFGLLVAATLSFFGMLAFYGGVIGSVLLALYGVWARYARRE